MRLRQQQGIASDVLSEIKDVTFAFRQELFVFRYRDIVRRGEHSLGSLELVEIALPMQEDYIQRVHQCRTGGLSHAIRSCCDYIDLHLEDALDLASLAEQTGYEAYYLSRKFKKETGLPPSDYIRKRRLERAALLLRTKKESTQQISERLRFCSPSYFAESFKSVYGVTPTVWREQ